MLIQCTHPGSFYVLFDLKVTLFGLSTREVHFRLEGYSQSNNITQGVIWKYKLMILPDMISFPLFARVISFFSDISPLLMSYLRINVMKYTLNSRS